MNLNIKNRIALVFGGSTGLGRAIAEELAKEGAQVALSARDESRLLTAAREIGAAATVSADLLKPGAARSVVSQVEKKLGPVDILITNTGGPPKGGFQDLTDAQWRDGFQNLWLSAVDGMQAVLPQMTARRWGRILLVTSAAAREPMAGLTISNGLRAGLLGLMKSLSQEVGQHGITVNALLPGYTRTERLMELGIAEEKITAQIPARRLGEPHELAALAAFLASDRASYITGQAIACDGGYLKSV